jgi:hypothetical protein
MYYVYEERPWLLAGEEEMMTDGDSIGESPFQPWLCDGECLTVTACAVVAG